MRVDRIVVFHAVGHKPKLNHVASCSTAASLLELFNAKPINVNGFSFREDPKLRPGEIHIKLDCF